MASVTSTITTDYITYTMSSSYASLVVNFLFSFLNQSADFRYSTDGGNSYFSWVTVNNSNIRAVSVETTNSNIVVQVQVSLDGVDDLIINASSDKLLINSTDILNIN